MIKRNTLLNTFITIMLSISIIIWAIIAVLLLVDHNSINSDNIISIYMIFCIYIISIIGIIYSTSEKITMSLFYSFIVLGYYIAIKLVYIYRDSLNHFSETSNFGIFYLSSIFIFITFVKIRRE